MGRLFLLFTLVPVLELYLLMGIGARIGAIQTLALIVVTGVLGAYFAKREGLRVLRSWQEAVSRGQMPEEGVLGGVLVLVGGVLLVTPGVLTDAVGLALLFPVSRRVVVSGLRRYLGAHVTTQGAMGFGGQSFVGTSFGGPAHNQGRVVFEEVVITGADAVGPGTRSHSANVHPHGSTARDRRSANARPVAGAVIDVDGEELER